LQYIGDVPEFELCADLEKDEDNEIENQSYVEDCMLEFGREST
jgi:hypothetical protein